MHNILVTVEGNDPDALDLTEFVCLVLDLTAAEISSVTTAVLFLDHTCKPMFHQM
jgi:hypothetical protein